MKNNGGYRIRNQYGSYFVTLTIVGWVDIFSRKECKAIIIDSLGFCMKNKGLILHAYVIMESHLHLIVSAEAKSDGLSGIIRDFKRHTARQILTWIKKGGRESRREWLLVVFRNHAKSTRRNTEYQVWQKGNRPKLLEHPRFTEQKLNYIHNNPVTAGIVDKPEDYLHSSARNYAGREDFVIPVSVLDFGVQEGYLRI